MPGPVFNLISRFNYLYNNKKYLNIEHECKLKRAILLLIGGGSASNKLKGNTNEDLPLKQAGYIFGKLNAKLLNEDIVSCLDTDEIDVRQNKELIDKIVKLASSCNN